MKPLKAPPGDSRTRVLHEALCAGADGFGNFYADGPAVVTGGAAGAADVGGEGGADAEKAEVVAEKAGQFDDLENQLKGGKEAEKEAAAKKESDDAVPSLPSAQRGSSSPCPTITGSPHLDSQRRRPDRLQHPRAWVTPPL